jgi:hypothetical protein
VRYKAKRQCMGHLARFVAQVLVGAPLQLRAR